MARRARWFVVGGAVLVVVAILAYWLGAAHGGDATAAPAPSPTPTPTPTATGLDATEIYQRVSPSVVVVRAGESLGTGVIAAEDGSILTAHHVVRNAEEITLTFADGTRARATVVESDPRRDIATLRPARLPEVVVPATIGGAAEIGAPVVAIGNPLGLTHSVSTGVISGLNRTSTDGRLTGLIQFDAAVNPGSSGGPLLDAQGAVIGIVVSIADPGGDEAFAGIAFAVPIGEALGGQGDGPSGGGPQI
ncbi:S1C family serine protease [Thermopolyspora flexuosa]|uniref:S1C family serine protease n=1 Tax=Thermopolyspora flexuosa TaxID=103836 RepID=UPI001E3521DD|nr:trypsin-like peptidase domain-containing protein [Thermopolyspora flexuosa]